MMRTFGRVKKCWEKANYPLVRTVPCVREALGVEGDGTMPKLKAVSAPEASMLITDCGPLSQLALL